MELQPKALSQERLKHLEHLGAIGWTFEFRLEIPGLGLDPVGLAGDLRIADAIRPRDDRVQRHAFADEHFSARLSANVATVAGGGRIRWFDADHFESLWRDRKSTRLNSSHVE